MYIFKNAFKNITRQKGRSILIFILIVTIAFSSCVALCIRSSANAAKESTYESMSISATITSDRTGMMESGFAERGTEGEDFELDSDAIMEEMAAMQEGLSLEELQEYEDLEEVASFYYTRTIGLDGSSLEAYETSTTGFGESQMMGGSMSMAGGMEMGISVESSGDFEVTSFSTHDGMTNFIDGTCVIYDGTVFDMDDSASCIISQEVAYLNDISVGDTIELANPSLDSELYEIEVTGIFSCETTDAYANNIYISEDYYQVIAANSESVAESYYVDEDETIELDTTLVATTSGVFTFASVDDYESFSVSVFEAGLDEESYTVVSSDLTEYEASITPLENLTSFTTYFFLVVLAIGSVILILFNIFTIRERKYEIGVLAAIGMPKVKVAQQFICETFMITILAIVIGGVGGTIVATPLANVLLADQIESLSTDYSDVSENFGGNFQGESVASGMEQGASLSVMGTSDVDYVDSISVSMDVEVIAQLLAIALILSVVASSVGVVSVLRYDPLTILSNRS